jgi:hypothetical protein
MNLSLRETFDTLKQLFPGRKITVWRWIESREVGDVEHHHLDVDEQTFRGANFTECVEKAKAGVPTLAAAAALKREQAKRLLAEAEKLETA